MVAYGITPHFQVTLSAPINLLDAAQPPARMMSGDAEAGIGWRFHRSAPRVGTRFETTLFTNLVIPDLQRSPGLMSSLRRAPGGHVGVVTGLASRRHYLWAGAGYTGYGERGGDRRPHLFNYSVVWGYRPPPLEKDYPHWDWRLFLEATGEAWSRVRHAGMPMPESSGHQVFVGPTTLGIYKNFAVSGGVQFPVYREVGGAFPRERLRFAVIISYFLFRFPGGHQ
jgi:hypothetical protein